MENNTETNKTINKLKACLNSLFVISSSLDKEEIMGKILDQVKNLIECEKASLFVVNEERDQLVFLLSSDEDDNKNLANMRLKMSEGMAGTVWENGVFVFSNDLSKDIRFSKKGDEKTNTTTNSILSVPLVLSGEIVGVLNAINKIDKNFELMDVELLQYIAMQASMSMKNSKLYELATVDSLTGLNNKGYFQTRINEEFKRSMRYKQPLSVIMFDIDFFKAVNDTYGHKSGDYVLKEIAGVLRDSCRNNVDIPCRVGGEEFCVISPETSEADAFHLAERVRKEVEKITLKIDDKISIKKTLSAGVASINEKSNSFEEVIDSADKALYHSKGNGRNQVTKFSEIDKGN